MALTKSSTKNGSGSLPKRYRRERSSQHASAFGPRLSARRYAPCQHAPACGCRLSATLQPAASLSANPVAARPIRTQRAAAEGSWEPSLPTHSETISRKRGEAEALLMSKGVSLSVLTSGGPTGRNVLVG